MNELEIRRATVADAQPLAEAYRSAYRENQELGFPAKAGSATESDVAEWIREHRVLIATIDGEVVGGVRFEATNPERAERAVRDWGYGTVWSTTLEDHPYPPNCTVAAATSGPGRTRSDTESTTRSSRKNGVVRSAGAPPSVAHHC